MMSFCQARNESHGPGSILPPITTITVEVLLPSFLLFFTEHMSFTKEHYSAKVSKTAQIQILLAALKLDVKWFQT
jgi:hypothetical protein